MTVGPDVHSSLAEIDRKLRELQRELSMFSGQPAPETPAPASPPAPPARPVPAIPPRPAASAPPPPPSSPPAGPSPEGDPVVADARETAARILDDAGARIAEMGERIQELHRVYSELRRSAGALVEDFGRMPAGAGPGDPRPREYSGTVVVNAGPFADIATLGAFEKSLNRLPGADGVRVRGFEGDRALLDLRLPSPIPLVEELRRVVPFAFRVGEVGHGMVTIHLEDTPPRA